IPWDGESICITGLEIGLDGYRKFGRRPMEEEEIESRVGTADSSYQILLAHNPAYVAAYRKWGADLILSGHLHGGIVRIPGIGGVIAPDFTLFPKYSGDIYREEDATVVVSKGLGAHSVPIRLLNPAEMVVLVLNGD
ncbi:MAG: metallophosphoesterase, partial [[Clostridium] scindens]